MKTFYSAEDIEALAAQGVTELRVDQETVLTHLARDTAQRLGISLIYAVPASPAASRVAPASPPSILPQAVAAKPKGCQHGPLPRGPDGAVQTPSSSDSTVSELIGLVKGLADRGTDS
jgi:hypothetical protein